jgi:hypothetical protein
MCQWRHWLISPCCFSRPPLRDRQAYNQPDIDSSFTSEGTSIIISGIYALCFIIVVLLPSSVKFKRSCGDSPNLATPFTENDSQWPIEIGYGIIGAKPEPIFHGLCSVCRFIRQPSKIFRYSLEPTVCILSNALF